MNGISLLTGSVPWLVACTSIAFALSPGVHAGERALPRHVDLPWEAQSRGACDSDNFEPFFEAFVRSPQVRMERTAKRVEHRSRADPSKLLGHFAGAQYQELFAISLSDYYYTDTNSMHKWESGKSDRYEDLWVTIEPAADRIYRVHYSKAILRDDGEGDGKTLVRPYGAKRSYLFEMKHGCWQLTQDLR